MIKVIDDLLPKAYADAIANDMFESLRYTYMRNTSIQYKSFRPTGPVFSDENTFDRGQMSAGILDAESGYTHPFFYETLKPMIYILNDKFPEFVIEGVVRVKGNILTQKENAPEYHYNSPHQDAPAGCYSMIYYCDDSDGDTFLFDQYYEEGKLPEKVTLHQRISPKKNRVLIFESNRYHASSNPRMHRDRMILNFVFKANEGNR
jgi:hypothetical protein